MFRLTAACSILLLASAAPPAPVETFTGKAVGISDGDTLTVLVDRMQVKIPLEGIDAPEKSQAFGSKAKQALTDLVAGKSVEVHKTGEDRYGRTLARVIVDGQDVSESMIAQGFAWHYKKYSKDETLANLEDTARNAKRGLWADANPLPPWEFRTRKSAETSDDATAAAKSDSELSHWLNTSSNTRHNASCEYFKNTKRGRMCGANEGKACGQCGG